MSDLRKQLLTNKLPPPSFPKTVQPMRRGGKKSYDPLDWKDYFDSGEDVKVHDGTIRVYRRGNSGPLLVFIHGGGFSALSFALFSNMIVENLPCQCLAYDIRGHGDTRLQNENELSIDNLKNDVGNVLHAIFPNNDSPPTVLIGHSLGGAIAVHAAAANLVDNLAGIVVIDVVEGSALESLSSMSIVLAGRPKTFKSIDKAIQWCVTSGMIRNLESARVSFPGQLVCKGTGLTAVHELSSGRLQPTYVSLKKVALSGNENSFAGAPLASAATNMDSLAEEDEFGVEQSLQNISTPTMPPPQPSAPRVTGLSPELTWRIDLNTTSPYWSGWFKGLSNMLLSLHVPKLVVLAGTDRLDKDLTIGQMQGKFQLNLLQHCGHIIHEDVPDKLMEVVATFLIRNRIVQDSGTVNKVFPCC